MGPWRRPTSHGAPQARAGEGPRWPPGRTSISAPRTSGSRPSSLGVGPSAGPGGRIAALVDGPALLLGPTATLVAPLLAVYNAYTAACGRNVRGVWPGGIGSAQ